MEVTIFVPTVT